MSIKIYNVQHNGTVHTPLLIVHGESKVSGSGVLTVSHQGNAFPPLHYEVNQGFFKAIVHLEPGENPLTFTHSQGQVVGGFPQYDQTNKNKPYSVGFTINYVPLLQNRPVHLCVLLAKDSPATFDSTPQKKSQEGNGLDIAIKKLRVGARLMQAFTNEQMLRAGFGNRTFNFAEEYTKDTQFLQEQDNQRFRSTIKIHVIRSKKTLKELRDPNLAQQNSKGNNTGGLFGIAMDELRNYGGPFTDSNKPVQAAVMYLDATYDQKLNMILTHAALGGGDDRIRLAIFGSHGLYSWPAYFEHICPAFLDTSPRTNDVANDANECGSYWECLAITLGAFMHEIGHLLGCPHQRNGVMLRDYVTLNRSFLTRESYSTRTKKNGLVPILPKDECTWHRLDLLRFLHHRSFTLPSDFLDPTFAKNSPVSGKASVLPVGNKAALLKSATGIYAIEIFPGDLAEGFIEFLPKSIGGQGAQKEIYVTVDEIKSRLPRDKQNGKISLHIQTVDGNQTDANDFEKLVSDSSNFIQSDFGLGRGQLTAIKSNIVGKNSPPGQPIIFDPTRVVSVRIYHGGAIDGIQIITSSGGASPQPPSYQQSSTSAPPLPNREYKNKLGSLISGFKNQTLGSPQNQQPIQQYSGRTSSVLFGKQTGNYTDFNLSPGEYIAHLRVRSGLWVDAIQIVTNTGRVSPYCGNTNGGGEGVLEAPEGYEIIGLFGAVGNWVDSLGVLYTTKLQ
ncbi:putative zinc metalloproteinase [Wickerhamomyces ciferrii]|uniref:Zinc metalloproteinase n=1 Tax=Wickerhamomyces ciferrii (strain ATCC 14091 / BCRC 22168 / CBS 111 / JCM 3599 / NBRC 0793 / NRRL Y-1031 F-60-10) TaxID=1206466 RepID=K0KQW7_WICCF|nr:putative zinc metalloproteinase [Wickerhamomyces ciferrii]CCH43668.1 putative zinc metalloproteinase [Wickerhamomyces ciferrii]